MSIIALCNGQGQRVHKQPAQTSTGTQVLDAATLIYPSNNITSRYPAYSWNAVSNSTWYYLWVNDSTGNVIKQWEL